LERERVRRLSDAAREIVRNVPSRVITKTMIYQYTFNELMARFISNLWCSGEGSKISALVELKMFFWRASAFLLLIEPNSFVVADIVPVAVVFLEE
jgi:hypothetical protein